MKYTCLTLLFSILISFSFGQKLENTRTLNTKIQASKTLSNSFKAMAGPVLRADDEDCTPPPCTGIIDPWTCECTPDLKDPWEDKAMASKMKKFIMFETAVSRGEGKSVLPKSMVASAKKKYPGKSLKAITNRMNFYARSVK